MKRFGKFLLWLAGGLALLLLLFHGVENWRGRRAWTAWKQARIAAGDRYDWAAPDPPVPDAENFAAAPDVARALRPNGTPFLEAPQIPDPLPGGQGWRFGQHEEPAAWARALKAPTVAEALAPAAARLDSLAAASRRPHCRMPHDLRKGEILGLLGFRSASRALRLRALDRLARGDASGAREDVITLLRVARHLQSDPTLISTLLQSYLAQQAMQPLWEGLADRRWAEEDLKALQEALGEVDLLRAMAASWRSERLWPVRAEPLSLEKAAELPPWRREPVVDFGGDPVKSPLLRRLLWAALIPKGWFHQNLLTWDRLWVERLEPCLSAADHRIHPARSREAARAVETLVAGGKHPYRILAAIAVPALLGQNEKIALRQTGLDQARVACALERYRLANGAYPEGLDSLVPAYLPRVPGDVAAGGPLRYRREGGGYLLYSLGSDERDDGGRGVEVSGQPAALKADQGDWTWRIPGR